MLESRFEARREAGQVVRRVDVVVHILEELGEHVSCHDVDPVSGETVHIVQHVRDVNERVSTGRGENGLGRGGGSGGVRRRAGVGRDGSPERELPKRRGPGRSMSDRDVSQRLGGERRRGRRGRAQD